MKKLLLFFAAAFSFVLLGNKASAQNINYNPSPFIFTVGVPVNLTPTASGGVANAVLRAGGTRSTTLPGGLTLNANGTITGTPTTVTATTNYEVTARVGGTNGVNSNAFTIQVVTAPVFSYTSNVYTYGTAITTLSATGTGIPITGATITPALPAGLTLANNGNITGTPTVASTIKSYTVTATGNNGGTGTATFNITVNPAALTVTATGPLKPYGTTIAAGTSTINFTYAGTVLGQTVTGVTLTPDANGASPTTPVGSPYVITPSLATGPGAFLASNYTITYVPYNGTVTTGNLNITANVSKVYGNVLTGGTGFTGFTTTGLATGETVGSVTVAYGTGSGTTDPVGVDANQVTVSAATGGTFNPANYNITYTTGTITVTGAPLTLTATGPTKTYGTALTTGASAINFTATGTIPGETVTSVTLTPNAAGLSATTAAGAGYTVTPSAPTGTGGFLASNYIITVVPYSGTVAQAPLTLTATGPLKPYGTTITAGISTINFTASGAITGQTVTSVTLTPDANGASSTTPVGSPYVITPSAPTGTGGFLASNYSITVVVYNGTVTTGNLNITANVSKVYGTTLTGGTGFTGFTATGLAAGETIGSVTVAYGTGSAAADPVAVYANQVTVSAATGGTFSPANYNITYSAGTITVTKAAITVTATGPTKTYGTALASGPSTTNFTVTGSLAPGESVTGVTFTISANGRTATAAAGLGYTVAPTLATGTGGFSTGNYTITYVTYNGTIAQAPLTITASTNNKPYGNILANGNITPPAFTYTGIQNGETVGRVAAVYGTGAASNAAIGTYTNQITISGAGLGSFTASNYAITYVQGNIVVGQGALTITATNVNKTYGATLTGGTGYTVFTTTGLATGETVGSVTVAYGTGSAATDAVGNYNNQVTLSTATGGTFNPANYIITYVTGRITVGKAALTITANSVTKNFGATLTSGAGSTAFTSSALQNGETIGTVTITYGTGSAAGAAVGVYANQVTPSAATGGTFNANNYNITYVSGSITVVASPPALTYATPDTYATSTAFTLTPTNGGSPVVSSSILPALPTGVTMSATGVISGSSATAGTFGPFVVTATNAAGTTSSNSFTIIFVSPPIISYSPSTNVYTAGVAITPLVPNSSAGGAVGAPGYGTGLSITGAGLNTPQGVTLDAAGNIYVADSGNGVIRKYNSAGVYQGTFGTGLTQPMGIVFDSAGNAYVLDYRGGRGRVYKFNAAGVLQATLNPVGGAGWDDAFGIAIDASNNLYVSNSFTFAGFDPYVTKFSTAGVTSATITTNIVDPTGIATDASGNLYVLDGFNGTVDKYNSSGAFVTTVISGLNFAEGLTIDSSGNIYVGDSGAGTVTQYSSSGTVLNVINGQTDPEGLAVDAKKDIYVTDANNNTLIEYPLTGGYYLTGTLPAGLSFSTTTGTFSGTPTAAFGPTTFTVTAYNAAGSGSTTVTLSCTVTPPAFHYSPSTNVYSVGVAIPPLAPIVTSGNIGAPGFGSPTSFSGTTLNTPQGVATDAAGNFYVADSGDGLIKKYNAAGVYQGTFGTIGGGFAGFNNPVGITFDAAGNAYVLDTGTGRVYKFNSAGVFQATLNPAGANLGNGFGIAFNASNGNLYVTNTGGFGGGFISEFTTAGAAVATIATAPIATPGSIVTDASGNIYEVDNGTGSVYKFSSTGTYISTIVTGLDNPFGLAIDAQGDLYVGDSADFFTGFAGAIYEYSPTGTLITTVTNTVTDPEGITLDSKGDIIVTDATDESVNLYPKNGGYYLSGILPAGLSFSTATGTFTGTPTTTFGPTTYTITGYSYGQAATTTVTLSCTLAAPIINYTPPTDVYCVGTAITALNPVNTGGPVSAMTFTTGTQITGATLRQPVGIGKDASGNLYVANSGNATISKYTSAGVYSATFGTGLTTPMGIVFDSTGNAYVLDQGTGDVYKFNSAGALQATLNPRGGGGFASGQAIAIDASGNLYVTENRNGNIYKFTTAGVLSQTITVAQISAPAGIAIDASGNIYVSDSNNNDVVVLNSAGAYVSTFATGFNGPVGLSIVAAGNIYVADTGNNQVDVYSAIGTLLTTITTNLNTPEGLITDASGNLYVADNGNNRLYKYTVTGNFTISAPLPAGLTFNTVTGTITGTPTALSAATVYTIGCSNTAGPATTTVNITVTTTPAFTYPPTEVYPANSAIANLTPVITVGAGTPASYSVSPALPLGLSLNTSTGVISGTPTTITAAANYTVTGTNTCGVGTFIINITINPAAPVVAYVTPQVYTDGTAIAPLNPNNTGGTATWSISTPLPTGLIFDTTTGIISGNPSVVSPATDYIVTATNATATVTQTINITCNPALPAFTYTTPDVYNAGVSIPPLTPNSTGGAVTTWSVGPALPTGLNIDPLTGIISGIPAGLFAAANYTVTGTNVTGSATFVINITVTIDAPVISYITPDTYTVGSVIAPLIPTNTGGAPASYAISPGLPAGLNFNTVTGVITGTPTAVSAAANYVVTATNTGGVGTFTISIACVAGGPVLSYISPDVFPVNVAIAPVSPTNTGTAPVSYSISPNLTTNTGLTFDTSTGIISGTPTITSAAVIYTVTATDAGANIGTTTITISCSGYVDWIGKNPGGDWNDPANWATGAVPTINDIAGIGVNQTFDNFPNVLASAGIVKVGSVVIGTSSVHVLAVSTVAQAGGFVVNTGSILNISGGITYQSDANSGLGFAATISGAGIVNASGINVIANTSLGATYTETMASSVANLNLSSDIVLTSSDNAGTAFNSTFNVTGGITAVAGTITTSNTAAATSTLSVTGATLQLGGAAPLSGLSATGTNVISFNNAGATIEYSGGMQTYYTDMGITGLAGGESYNSIKFSGSGLKSPTGTNTNKLNIAGDFTNALTLNDASDYIDLSLPTVIFNGAAQNINAGNGTGTTFYNTNFTGASATTIQSGEAYIGTSGTLTMSGTATLAAGGLLTLNSAAAGSATVAPIPASCAINGTVNVQRFVTGGSGYRGYRLASSPVNGSDNLAAGGNINIYSINYLINSVYLKGTSAAAGGFDEAGNPNIYLYRENLAPSNTTFTSGNFRGVNTLGFAPNFNYLIDNDPGTFNIPVGGGFMFFFRGDRHVASIVTESGLTYVPASATLTASGTLNQQQVTATDWYTPASQFLGWTNTPGNSTVRGYNLVGNPYASSIDWNKYQIGSTTTGIYASNIAPYIYELDPISNNYDVYNQATGAYTNNGTSIIASGQGFFVQALSTGPPQLIFNESAKTSTQNTGPTLFMSTRKSLAAVQAAPRPHLRLQVAMDSINTDDIYIGFNASASNGYVPSEDATSKPGNGKVGLSSFSSDNVSLAINQMPFPGIQRQVIPLSVRAISDGAYTMNLTEQTAIPALFTVWLKDAYMKDSLDVRANPTYVFNILHSDTNTYGAHRFTLVMGQNPALMIHLLSFGASKIQTGDQVVWTTENEQNYTNFTVERSTDNGTTFADLGGFPSSGQGAYNYLDRTPANGANMYRLKIVDLNGAISYSNVVTIMYANTNGQIAINGMMVYPNPTAGKINLSITSSQTNGTSTQPAKSNYSIEIVNNLGSVIKSSQSSSPLWQSDVSTLTPGTYFIRVIDTSNNKVVGKSAFVKL